MLAEKRRHASEIREEENYRLRVVVEKIKNEFTI